MADTTTTNAGAYGRLLASQPCETEAIHYSHFDCWPGGDDSVYPDEINQSANAAADYWQHPACVELAHRLCDEWAESIGTVYLRTLIPSLSMQGWFAFAATLFVHAGYSVYNSDTCFEVFRTDELIRNGEEMDEDE